MKRDEVVALFESSLTARVEEQWLGAVFDVLADLPRWCDEICMDNERRFTGGHIRRAALDARVLPIVRASGGDYWPGYTHASSESITPTSHYPIFLLGKLKITNNYSNQYFGSVREADIRDSLISTSLIPLPNADFQKFTQPPGDLAYVQFRYSCQDDRSLVPIKASFLVFDQDGSFITLDAIDRNSEYVTSRLPVVEEKVGPTDQSLVTLKQILRRKEA